MTKKNNNIITISNLVKDFKLPHEKHQTLKASLINFRNRSYEMQHVLRNINFEVKEGEFFGVVGRNGGGKSTLLKILAGIYQPTKGEVSVNGSLTPFIELGVGFHSELSGKDNVFLNGAMLGMTREEVAAVYDEVVEFAELERFMDQKLKNYSSGMMVRLAFSIAIQAKSDILLIDEVLAVGDVSFQRKCYNYFDNLKRNKKTIVFISHDMEAIKRFCDRAMLIDNGKITKIGKPNEVSEAYFETNKKTVKNKEETSKIKDSDYARFKSVKINKREDEWISIDKNEDIQLDISIEARKEIAERSVVAIVVVGEGNKPVFWTNTIWEDIDIKKINKNDEIEISLKVQNVFPDGKYKVDFLFRDYEHEKEYLRKDDIFTFDVFRQGKNSHLLHPDIELKVKQ